MPRGVYKRKKTTTKKAPTKKVATKPKEITKVSTPKPASNINPKHYALRVNGQPIEAIDIVEGLFPDDVHVATALIYILRAGKKPDSSYVQDISKAVWWLVRGLMFHKIKYIELPEGAPVNKP